MSGKPVEPPPPPSRPDPTADQHRRSSRAGERIGPLAIDRHVKDDGRALILYSSSSPHGDADGAMPSSEPRGNADDAVP
jgi:hypothetical protein